MLLSRYYFFVKRYCSYTLDSKRLLSSSFVENAQKEVNFFNNTDSECDNVYSGSVYNSKHCKDISEYINSKQCLRELRPKIPNKYLQKKYNQARNLLLVDNDVAGELFTVLKPHLETYNGYILEANAGLGLLTARLLEAKLSRLYVYESDLGLHQQLQHLIHRSGSDARLFNTNLLLLWHMVMRDRDDRGNRVGAALDGLRRHSWEDDPAMKIIAALSSDLFIFHILYSIIFQSGIFAYGRPELLVTVPSETYAKLSAGPDTGPTLYLSKSVLFQIIFELTLLGEVPQKAYLPWLTEQKNERNKRKRKKEEKIMYVVKMTARRDLFQKIPAHLIKPLWFFVRLIMQKRKARLISTMEEWIPDCGPRLIAQGHTIFTKCGSLTPEVQLSIFLECSSWPEFNVSSFIPSMESLLVKLSEPGASEEVITNSKKDISTKSVSEKQEDLLDEES